MAEPVDRNKTSAPIWRLEHSSSWSGILSGDFTDCCFRALKWAHKFQTFRAPWQHLQDRFDTSAWAPLLL